MEYLPFPLPYDVLVEVLARLAPRSLAVSRCVCKEWRAIVDNCCQLRSNLLPITLGGIFIRSYETDTPDFFARPSVARRVAGRLESFVPMNQPDDEYLDIMDCCNGLLLLEQYVVNPATKQWVCLPRCDGLPVGHDGVGIYWSYLVFDPTVSPHYEVISMQHPSNFNVDEGEKQLEGLQWPPPMYVMRAYSSRRGRWEERRFALDDDEGPKRSIDGVSARAYGHAAYWHGVLYVHCNSQFILRINLSDDKYQVIDLPTDANASEDLCEFYLGKSKKGIYFAAIANDTCRVLIWFLKESAGKLEWVFKHGINQRDLITHFWGKPDAQTDRHWILLQDGESHQKFKEGPTMEVEQNLDWGSDDDERAVHINDYYCDTKTTYGFMIFGFHPYEEVVFLYYSSRVMAYHFGKSKVQDLGFMYSGHMIRTAFVYTPFWDETCLKIL